MANRTLKPRVNKIKIFLTNFVCDALIGVYPQEKLQPQRVRIDIELTAGYGGMPKSIDDVLDYNILREGVKAIIRQGHIPLQETLCESIVNMCLSFPQAKSAHVRVAKLEAFSDCEAVGCELSKTRLSTAKSHVLDRESLPASLTFATRSDFR